MKNKILLLVLACLLFSLNCNSQDNTNGQIGNPNVFPPEVSSFQKVNFLPVSNYTGRANIEIPFYNIDLEGLSIPIGLSYNTSGVKPNDVASSVGLNWSLNAGGLISKNIKGIDDFYNDYLHQIADYQSGIEDVFYDKRIGFLSYSASHFTFSNFPGTDDLPDTFNANAPGVNFSFIHNRGKIIGDAWTPDKPFTLNALVGDNQSGQYVNLIDNETPWDLAPFILNGSNDYKIEETYSNFPVGMFGKEMTYSGDGFANRFWLDDFGSYNPNIVRYGISSISIKNLNGFQYIFDKIDTSQYVINRNDGNNQTVTFPNYLGTQSINFTTNVNVVAYHLSKIIDLKTNKFVEFQYENYYQAFSEIIDNNIIHVNSGVSALYRSPKGVWQKFPKLNRIKKIIFEKGKIEFNYELNRLDVTGEKALTNIVLYDNKNNQIKKAILSFDYFQSAIQQTSPFSKRLKLNSVTLQGSNADLSEQYRFTYNNTELPLRVMAVTDLFGYNNGYANNFQFNLSNNQYVIQPPNISAIPNPSAYFHPNNSQNSFLPEPISSNAIYISGNYSLSPNLEFCKAGILERIDYPTGGYNSLVYELNNFKINNFQMQGGGLRVKEQKISDGVNVRSLKFEYLKSDGTTSGAVASIPKFIDFDYNINNTAPVQSSISNNITPAQFNSWFSLMKNNFPKGNIELTNGSYVGYSRIKVYEEGKGYISYEYTNPSTHPNTQSNFICIFTIQFFSSIQMG